MIENEVIGRKEQEELIESDTNLLPFKYLVT